MGASVCTAHISPLSESLGKLVFEDVPYLFHVADLAVAHVIHSSQGRRKAPWNHSHEAVLYSVLLV